MDITNAKGQEWQCISEADNIRSRINGKSLKGIKLYNTSTAEGCAKGGEISKISLHNSSSHEEFNP